MQPTWSPQKYYSIKVFGYIKQVFTSRLQILKILLECVWQRQNKFFVVAICWVFKLNKEDHCRRMFLLSTFMTLLYRMRVKKITQYSYGGVKNIFLSGVARSQLKVCEIFNEKYFFEKNFVPSSFNKVIKLWNWNEILEKNFYITI